MLLSFFLLGAFGWWCLTIFFIFYVFLCIEKENLFWPISMIWSLLDDFVKKTIQHLVIKFQKLYQTIV